MLQRMVCLLGGLLKISVPASTQRGQKCTQGRFRLGPYSQTYSRQITLHWGPSWSFPGPFTLPLHRPPSVMSNDDTLDLGSGRPRETLSRSLSLEWKFYRMGLPTL